MKTGRYLVTAVAVMLLCAVGCLGEASAQTVQLSGSVSPDALKLPTYGDLPATQTLPLQIWLKPRNQAQLNKLLADQQNPKSPQYHKWLTPQEYTQRFGATQAQYDKVARWLSNQGFQVTPGTPADGYIKFTGSVFTIGQAFNTRVMKFDSSGSRFGNLTEPVIPGEFAATIGAIQGLNNLERTVPLHTQRKPAQPRSGSDLQWLRQMGLSSGSSKEIAFSPASRPQAVTPQFHQAGLGNSFGPQDFYTFYDETASSSSGGGAGNDCIAIYAESDIFDDIVGSFTTKFGLNSVSLSRVNTDGATQGTYNDAETEALLDVEWAHAVAPGAPITLYLGQSLSSSVQKAVTDNSCGSINISFGLCGPSPATVNAFNGIFSQAATQGISVFVSSGDQGAAGLVAGCQVGTSRNVNEMSASPNVTSVGGTGFTPNFNASGNDVGSTAENAWNDSDLGGGGTGGGVSTIFSKPAFQNVSGGPGGTMRTVPDIAMIASPDRPGVFMFDDNQCAGGAGCGTDVPTMVIIGGTSLSAPVWAGISKLIVQKTGSRLGNMDTTIYNLASANQSGNGFRDVTSGNNSGDFGSGVSVTGFDATSGYDETTGWGTVDINNFVNAYASAGGGGTPTPTSTATSTATATPTATPTPKVSASIKLSPASLNFLTVKRGRIKSKVATLTNTSKNTKKIKGVTITFSGGTITGPADFQGATNCTGAVAPKGKCTVTVVFAPTVTGSESATVQINSNASNSPTIFSVRGTGK